MFFLTGEQIGNRIDEIVLTALLICFSILILIIYKRKLVRILTIILGLGAIATVWLNLTISTYAIILAFVAQIIIVSVVNAGVFRNLIANPTKNVKILGNRQNNEIVSDDETVINEICEAVELLSKTKTGALITFERKDTLENYTRLGTRLDAPVTTEIIQTIFFPGTRLHDGAIVIKDNLIRFASVYYTPTTKPLAGKYGARHRAALGVSESTDAITIIVSEETGRISIADNGDLDSVPLDKIKRTLLDHLDENDK